MASRREFLTLAIAPLLAEINRDLFLIAHRGGVVDANHPENSRVSIRSAIERGYGMIEVDIRRTADGRAILQHDTGFRRFFGHPGAVADMKWEEIRNLRSKPGNESPVDFEEACRMCSGRIRLMLDIKSDSWPDAFYEDLCRTMEKYELLRSAYLLGGAKLARFFDGKCMASANRNSLRLAIERREDVKTRYYLFELGSTMDEQSVALCRRAGVVPVAAINVFRYTGMKRDEWTDAVEDVRRLEKLGVRHYQIDSWYESLFHSPAVYTRPK